MPATQFPQPFAVKTNKRRTSIASLIAAAQNAGDKTNLGFEPQQPCRSLIQSACPTEWVEGEGACRVQRGTRPARQC